MPTSFLAIAVLAAWGPTVMTWHSRAARVAVGCALAGFILLALWRLPVLWPERLALWARCIREGSSYELRDRLALNDGIGRTDWQDLARVAEFLGAQGAGDREVTCYHDSTHPLYLMLGREPSTRYLHFHFMLEAFPAHRPTIRDQLNHSGHRYVVSDLRTVYRHRHELRRTGDSERRLPAGFPKQLGRTFPWDQPVVYRAGRYVVHRVEHPVDQLGP
jgi:hypothetical protein